MSIREELLDQIWSGQDPFDYASAEMTDFRYPDTNIKDGVIEAIATIIKPEFWLELGTMTGGSIIKVIQNFNRLKMNCSFVCIDPFTGDVNMWAWERELAESHKWRYLNLLDGRPTIYDRFRANINKLQMAGQLIPLVCTSIIGLKLINRLISEKRLSKRPDVIYLDSAHEPGETFLELLNCWNTVRDGGVIFGDDWSWDAVRGDVTKFASQINVNYENVAKLLYHRPEAHFLENGIVVEDGQWILFK
ncbi:class I SAM-dependent methyltransferase [Acidiphilium sp.]|uniref:class I SAM-dependent methyltransferase n=1 Tax=Acidiphilium sp. TaxID=527 RepID=UPI003D0532F3